MESCEDDTEVESSDGSISPSSGSSDTELEDKPPDSSVSILASLESSDTNDDLIPPSSNDTEKREISTDAGILKSGDVVSIKHIRMILLPFLVGWVDQ